jgi:hypothetical protein
MPVPAVVRYAPFATEMARCRERSDVPDLEVPDVENGANRFLDC